MKITKLASTQPKVVTVSNGADFISEAQLTIGVAPVLIVTPAFGKTVTIVLINRSAGGQTIRVGFNPSFAPNFGLSLLVNDVVIYENVNFSISAVASGIGALLDTSITQSGY
jgi:hypothetical protein